MTYTDRRHINKRSTSKHTRRGLLFAGTVLLLLLLVSGPLSMFFFGNSAMAQAGQNLSEIQYKVVEIHKGDSLWSIARENMGPGYSDIYEYIRDIRSCNQLETDYITSGNYLMIPYYEIEGTEP